jgi:hypothetical protein
MKENIMPDWKKLADLKPPKKMGGVYAGCWNEGEAAGYARCMIERVWPLCNHENEINNEGNIQCKKCGMINSSQL